MSDTLTAAPTLTRLALRRDVRTLALWVVGIVVAAAAGTASVVGLYDTERERLAHATVQANNVVARAFDGPASGVELGAIVVVELFGVLAPLAALMSTFLVVRHTRHNEESGRWEIPSTTAVGRQADLLAALLVAAMANAAVTLAVWGVLVGNGLDASGSILAAAAVGAVGMVFAAVAAVAVQIFDNTRAANAVSAGAVGVAFVARAIGDALGTVEPSGVEVRSSWPSWLSPIGWGQQARPFHQDNWNVLLLFVGLFFVLVLLAVFLRNRRDVGMGLLPQRRGPARASRRLLSPFGLAWRLQRGMLVGWMVGLGVLAVVFGALADELGDVVADSDQLREIFGVVAEGAGIGDAYVAVTTGLLATLAGGAAVQALLRMRVEESLGVLEPLLATAASRTKWMLSHVLCGVVGAVAVVLAIGVFGGLAYGLAIDDVSRGVGDVVRAAAVQIPAVLVLSGVVLVAYAVVPRVSVGLGWAALMFSLLLGQIGDFLGLPERALQASPFTHVPSVPAAPMAWTPLFALTGISLLLLVVAIGVFRRRDITLSTGG